MSSYWHCPSEQNSSEELFFSYYHNVQWLLFDAEVFVLFKVLKWVSYKWEQMPRVPLLSLSAVLVSQGKGWDMFLPLEFSHWFFCPMQSCWDIRALAGLANSSDAVVWTNVLVHNVPSKWSGGGGFKLHGNLHKNTPPFTLRLFTFQFSDFHVCFIRMDSPISSPHLHPMPVLLAIYYHTVP